MKALQSTILLLTVLTTAIGGMRGPAWDTLCIDSHGTIQLKAAGDDCCVPVHACEDAELACLAPALPGGHDCIDIPLPPTRLERGESKAQSAGTLALADLAQPAVGPIPAAPQADPFPSAPAIDREPACCLACRTIVLRC